MGIELTDDELREIREHAVVRLQASFVEYVRLLGAVREKLPTVTDDAIATVKRRFAAGMHQDDGQGATHAALFCALYQLAMDEGKQCILSMKAGRANSGVLRNLMWVTSSTWESLPPAPGSARGSWRNATNRARRMTRQTRRRRRGRRSEKARTSRGIDGSLRIRPAKSLRFVSQALPMLKRDSILLGSNGRTLPRRGR